MRQDKERYDVQNSTLLEYAEYDHLMENLLFSFKKGGGIYTYCAVPYEVFEEFKKAESHGQYFHKNIKGKFEFLKKEERKDVRTE